jgi:DNA-binding CsgD family transcriptional regulator
MIRGRRAEAALSFLEAAYAWDVDVEPWLRGLIRAAVKVWGRPRWICAFEYDLSPSDRFGLGPAQFWNATPRMKGLLIDRIAQRGPETAALYRTISVGYSRPMGGIDDTDSRVLALTDCADYFGINGFDGGEKGCFIGVGAERTALTAPEMILFQRLASHLASAYRCRNRLKAGCQDPLDGAEALLSSEGSVLEASASAAEPAARKALSQAGRSIATLRDRRSEGEPTESWRPRVVTRWTLVNGYSRRGERYIVARENQAPAPGLGRLTEREQQVVASAAAGKSNKEIAYDLGISASTTRVLLSRAYARLGISSRKELFQLPSVRGLRGES